MKSLEGTPLTITIRKFWPALLALATPLFSADTSKLTYEQMEKFLQDGKILSMKGIGTGITNTQRAKLIDGTMEHDAHVQCIDEAKTMFQGTQGNEMNFKDTWKFNVAAYRLGRVLELDMIPVSIERKVNGNACAVTWWVDNAMMESERLKKKQEAPDRDRWNREMHIVRVFDQLIYNQDRNLTNLLIDPDWRIWMIDHTRAFRLYNTVKEKKDLVLCDRKLLERLRTINAETLKPLKPYVNDAELKALLRRRDVIVKFFDDEVKQKGAEAILYDRPAR
jgi:hypothetical protein